LGKGNGFEKSCLKFCKNIMMLPKKLTNLKSIFFDNLSIKQTIFKNTFWLAFANGISKLSRFVLFIYVARILGASEYGKFTFAMAFVGLFIIIADFGLSQIITREFAREKDKEKEFSAIVSLKIILCIVALIPILIGSFFITSDPVTQKIIFILAASALVESFTNIIYAFFQARQKMEYLSFGVILAALVTIAAGLFILFYFPSAQNLSKAYLSASVITLFFILFYFNFKIQRLAISFNKSIWKKFLLMSWPLALAGAAGSICNQTDSVMLGYFKQITQNGWYNAAYRVMGTTLIIVGLISSSIFPVLCKYKELKEKFQEAWDYFMTIVISIGSPLFLGGIFLAPKIIDFLYGPIYAPAVLAFQILMASGLIIYFYQPFYQTLLVFDQQRKIFWVILTGALFNVILNWVLIPKYSLNGAAFATAVTQLVILFLLIKLTKKFTSVTLFNSKLFLNFVGAVISSLIMYLVILRPQVYNLSVIFSVTIGAIVYFLSFFALRHAARFLNFYEKK
jgi:O-antigen/teichoic acid export membrane protein